MKGARVSRWGLLTAILVAAPAAAERVWSIGAGIGWTDPEPFCRRIDIGDCTRLALKFHAGRDLTRNLRFEIRWLKIQDRNSIGDPGKNFELDIDGPAIAVMPMIEASESVRLFGSLGRIRWQASGFKSVLDPTTLESETTHEFSSHGTDWFLGFGIRFAYGNAALRAEWEKFEIDGENVPVASLGYEYTY